MRHIYWFGPLLACFLTAACTESRLQPEVGGSDVLEDSRRIATDVRQKLSDALARSLDGGNILRTFSVCRYDAVKILSDVSRATGMKVSRVSLAPRNPGVAAADAWEQRVLREFEWRVRAGEQAHDLEHAEIVDEPAGRAYRYVAAFPVHAACLSCHGPEAGLTAAVRAQLARDYPVGPADTFTLGGFGGAISIRRSW